MTWLKIDVLGFPRVLVQTESGGRPRHGPSRGCLLQVVDLTISSTQVPLESAHVEDSPLPDGTVCDGRPSGLLELCENTVEIIKMDHKARLTVGTFSYCESDALQVAKRYLEMIKGEVE